MTGVSPWHPCTRQLPGRLGVAGVVLVHLHPKARMVIGRAGPVRVPNIMRLRSTRARWETSPNSAKKSIVKGPIVWPIRYPMPTLVMAAVMPRPAGVITAGTGRSLCLPPNAALVSATDFQCFMSIDSAALCRAVARTGMMTSAKHFALGRVASPRRLGGAARASTIVVPWSFEKLVRTCVTVAHQLVLEPARFM